MLHLPSARHGVARRATISAPARRALLRWCTHAAHGGYVTHAAMLPTPPKAAMFLSVVAGRRAFALCGGASQLLRHAVPAPCDTTAELLRACVHHGWVAAEVLMSSSPHARGTDAGSVASSLELKAHGLPFGFNSSRLREELLRRGGRGGSSSPAAAVEHDVLGDGGDSSSAAGWGSG